MDESQTIASTKKTYARLFLLGNPIARSKSRGELESQIEQTKQNIATLASEVVQIKQRWRSMPEEPDMSGKWSGERSCSLM